MRETWSTAMLKTSETILIFLLLSVLYKILPEDTVYPFLLAAGYSSTWQFFIWSICMRSILCYFVWAFAQKSDGIEYYLSMSFFCLTLGKNIDFILCGNTPYLGIDWLTFNTVSITAFCLIEILRQWRSQYYQSLY